MNESRVILYHSQSTSARTRFLKFDHGGVIGPEPLPDGVVQGAAVEAGVAPEDLLARSESALGLAPGSLALTPGLAVCVGSATADIHVYLARFTALDPPFDQVARHGGVFIDLTQARGLPTIDRQLLRQAYELILG